jgi:NAD(P)-dependent dehydrogenase (short-subunit alcohol dehydrogenase family)
METALITGGAGRIGRATAGRLVSQGWRVVLADIDLAAAQDVAAALGRPSQIEPIGLDITQLDEVERAIAAALARHGSIAALVNAAGGRAGADTGSFTGSDPATWRPVIDLHLRGVINCCYAVLPGMIAAGRGSIVSVAAVEGLRGDPSSAVFSAAKASVIVLTETLVRECQPAGIRVNAVIPAPPGSRARSGLNDEADSVANAVAFLVSDAAAQTTGSCLDVSGGWALH